MERTKISIIFEGKDIDQDKYVFSLTRKQAQTSELLTHLLTTEQTKDKDIKHVRLKLNCPSAIFPALRSYMTARESPTKEFCISGIGWMNNFKQLEIEWLRTLESKYIMDALVVASHMKIMSLCRLLYFYMQNESTVQTDDDFAEKFSFYPNELLESSSLTEAERGKLTSLVSGFSS